MWDFNKIPSDKRQSMFEAYNNGDFEYLADMVSAYQVYSIECESCGFKKDLDLWMKFIFSNYKDWINGEQIVL